MENNLGMRHLALKVKNFQECFIFYTKVLGMSIDWKPDDNNVYLTNGPDNLALHYDSNVSSNRDDSRLDHFGIFVKNKNMKNHIFIPARDRTADLRRVKPML